MEDPKTLLNDQNGSLKYDIFLSARACELHACMNDIVARHGCAARISYKVMQIPIPLSLSPLCWRREGSGMWAVGCGLWAWHRFLRFGMHNCWFLVTRESAVRPCPPANP